MTDKTANAADALLDQGEGQLKKFFDDVEDLVRRVTPDKDEAVSRVRKATERGVKQAVDVTSSAARATDDYVHRNPWTAIGVAAVACLALGSLLKRR